jgi:hypothetical protein
VAAQLTTLQKQDKAKVLKLQLKIQATITEELASCQIEVSSDQ